MDIVPPYKPTDPEILAEYSIEITDEWETSAGVGFTGQVTREGERCFGFENLGNGGCNTYLCRSAGEAEAYEIFKVKVKEAYPDAFEPDDTALIYLEVRDLPESL